jgi:hypothetical protein
LYVCAVLGYLLNVRHVVSTVAALKSGKKFVVLPYFVAAPQISQNKIIYFEQVKKKL